MKRAAVDIGTNSQRIIVLDEKNRLIFRDLKVTRIGEGISDSDKRLTESAIKRNIENLILYKKKCDELGVEKISLIGTSALRDASNSGDFIELAAGHGLNVEIISGTREAQLTYYGALSSIKTEPGKKYIVVDIGGGSTEFISGSTSAGGTIEEPYFIKSLNVGSVRFTEKYVTLQPVNSEEYNKLCCGIENEIRTEIRFGEDIMVCVGGTITSLAAIDRGLKEYDPGIVHNSTLKYLRLAKLQELFRVMTIEELETFPSLGRGRADIAVAGTAIVLKIMELGGFSILTVSDNGILTGLLMENN